MISVDVKISEMSASMTRALDQRTIHNGINLAFKKIGAGLTKSAKQGILSAPKTGARYYNAGLRRNTRASQPGSYPANQTSRLRRSIQNRITGFKMRLGSKMKYASFLQKADSPLKRDQGRNPFLKMAHDENKNDFLKIMRDSVMDNLK